MRRFMRRLLCDCAVALAVASITTANAAGTVGWIRDPGSPVLTESSDMAWFDSGYIGGPKIVRDAATGKYFMYYTGCVDANGVNRESIGLATASSLTGPWTKYDSANYRNALFAPGPLGSFYYSRNWGSGTIRQIASNSWEMWTIGDSDPDKPLSLHPMDRTKLGMPEQAQLGLSAKEEG